MRASNRIQGAGGIVKKLIFQQVFNNLAERELRTLVIARQLSFGSQSDAGAKIREILMVVLRSLAKQSDNIFGDFKDTLDKLIDGNAGSGCV